MREESVQTQQPFSPQYPTEEDTITIMDILVVLARHLKLIIIIPTIFCIITIIYALFFTSPVYVATAKFMSSGSRDDQSQMLGLAARFGLSTSTSSTPQWSYTDVIKSRTLARKILNRKFDTKKYGIQKPLLQILTYGNEEPSIGMTTLIQAGIGAVQGMIKIKTSGSMYELEISATEPQLATDVAHVVMEELDKYQREYNARKTTETRVFIEERLIETKSELENTEENLKNFREANQNIINSPTLQLAQERLARDVAVLTGVFTTLKQQLETAKIEEVKESDYAVILDPPETPLYPSKPKKKAMVIIAGFLGIVLGIIRAFIGEYVRNSNEKERGKRDNFRFLVRKNMIELLSFNKMKNNTLL